jgi:hypothetical protein
MIVEVLFFGGYITDVFYVSVGAYLGGEGGETVKIIKQ